MLGSVNLNKIGLNFFRLEPEVLVLSYVFFPDGVHDPFCHLGLDNLPVVITIMKKPQRSQSSGHTIHQGHSPDQRK